MAVRFDAVGDTADRTANLPGNTAFTYLLWAVMDSDQGSGVSQPIMAFLNGASTEGVIFAHTANILRIEVYDGGALINSADTASRPALGTPAAFFLRCSGTGANLLTGGFRSVGSNSFVTTSTTLPATVDAPATLYLGGLLGAFYYNGRRWNVKVWDRALSDAELLAESYYERVMFPASLNLYYPWTGSTDTADRSGNARNPTIGGTLTTGPTPVQLLRPSRRVDAPLSASPTNYTLTCDVGAYTLTGVAAALRRGYTLTADVGAYAITGQSATVSRGYRITADVGTYSLTGQDATLNYVPGAANYSLTCDTGAYTLTGHDATLTYSAGTANYTLTCETGAYALTGVDAITSFGRRLVADVGAYSLTGIDAALRRGYSLAADTGSYALTGYDADLVYTPAGPVNYTLTCEVGAYLLGGGETTFVTREPADAVSPTYVVGKKTKPKERKLMGGPRWQRHELENLKELVQVRPFEEAKAEQEAQDAIAKAAQRQEIAEIASVTEALGLLASNEALEAQALEAAILAEQQAQEDAQVMAIIAELL